MDKSKVDLVYLWCDGRDVDFARRKLELQRKLNIHLPEDNIGDQRYIQNNELLFSLRSVWSNIPWVNHIYIVTSGQRPSWLGSHPKISIVDHEEIIPRKLLPTFNSTVIETYIDRIPGLSEHFIYANDDLFFTSKLSVEDFFDKNGCPIVRLAPAKKTISLEQAEKDLDKDIPIFSDTLERAWVLFCKKNNRLIKFDTIPHSVDAYSLKMWRQTLEKYPEIYRANTFPFRTYREIQRLIVSYEMVYCYGAKREYITIPGFWNRLTSGLFSKKIWVSCRHSVWKIIRDMKSCHPQTVCVNNIDNPELFREYFESLFPYPAPWEAVSLNSTKNRD